MCDWKNSLRRCQRITPNDPEPCGKEGILRILVDSSHADDKKTLRSRTGYLIYLNKAPVAGLSKQQATVEANVFGAEFVAVKIDIDHLRSLRYKPRMMFVAIDGPLYIYILLLLILNAVLFFLLDCAVACSLDGRSVEKGSTFPSNKMSHPPTCPC